MFGSIYFAEMYAAGVPVVTGTASPQDWQFLAQIQECGNSAILDASTGGV